MMKKNVFFLSWFILLAGSFMSLSPAVAADYIPPIHTSSISNNEFNPIVAFPEWLTVSGNYAYFGSNITNTMVVLDISNPSNLVQVASLTDGDGGARLKGLKGIFISGNYAYTITNTTVIGDTLEIVNISDPIHPVHAGSIINGAGGANISGAYGVFVSGNYAYIASATGNALEIVDVSDPTNPTHSGLITNGTGGASLSGPYNVFVSGNYAYVTNYSGDSLEIVDVSDPANPVHSGKILNGTGGAKLDGATGIQVLGNYAYIISFVSRALEIVDISDPVNPVHFGLLNDGAGGAEAYGYEIFVSGNYAYLSNYASNSLEVVDISNPAVPTHVGLINDGEGGAVLNHPRGIYVVGGNAFIAVSASNAVEVINVSNPAAPTHRSVLTPPVYLGNPRDVEILNSNYAYVLSANSNALQVINISNPAAPTATGSIPLRSGGAQINVPVDIAFRGNYGYIACSAVNAGLGSIEIISIADQANPTHVNSIITAPYSSGAYGIAISGNYAFVTTYTSNTLEVLDVVTNPSAPTTVASLASGAGGALLNGAYGITISGNYAYVAAYNSNALEIIDISDPLHPIHAGSIANGSGGANLSGPRQVFVLGNYAYVTSWTGNAVEVVDISNPSNPTHAGVITNGTGGASLYNPQGIFVSGDYAYVGTSGMIGYTGTGALEVIDVSNPANPVHSSSVLHGSGGAKLNGARNLDILGDYVYISASDNTSNALEIIRIRDSVVPTITLLGSASITVSVGAVYSDAGATALDDVDGNITSSIVTVNPVNTSIPGTYTVTYNVDDNANNSAVQISRQVVVSSASGGGTSPVVYPSAIGTGQRTEFLLTGHKNIGLIDKGGVNYLSYIDNQADFSIINNTQLYSLRVSGLDLAKNIITLEITPGNKTKSIDLGDKFWFDLDNNQKRDLEIKFANVVKNQIELTLMAVIEESVISAPVIDMNIKLPTEGEIKTVIQTEKKLFTKTDKALTQRLAGRILLQTEALGRAWYLNPVSLGRYYLADGQAAYSALRKFGLGIKNSDLDKIPVGLESRSTALDTDKDSLPDKLEEAMGTDPAKADSDGDGFTDGLEVQNNYSPKGFEKLAHSISLSNRLKGRILLQIESRGQAWYINPVDGKRYYLADGAAAYEIMRYLSLGISNDNIHKIAVED